MENIRKRIIIIRKKDVLILLISEGICFRFFSWSLVYLRVKETKVT